MKKNKYIPERGDLMWVNFDPSSGKEIMKRRPAFVISRQKFNDHLGLVIVAPITSTPRGIKLETILPLGMATQGSILVYQLKTLDFEERGAELIELAPPGVIEEVTKLVRIITS